MRPRSRGWRGSAGWGGCGGRATPDYGRSAGRTRCGEPDGFTDVVRYRIRAADGAVGADLSGGLDSSAAVVLATAAGPVHAVTYTDGYTSVEDRTFAARVAEHTSSTPSPPGPTSSCRSPSRPGSPPGASRSGGGDVCHGRRVPAPGTRSAAAPDGARRRHCAGRHQRLLGPPPAGRSPTRGPPPSRGVRPAAHHRAGPVLEGAGERRSPRPGRLPRTCRQGAGARAVHATVRRLWLVLVSPGCRGVLADRLRPPPGRPAAAAGRR
ncbi:hypothetical protein CP973_20950 [Streptomyces albofaciens JCM 4342]|nr:hypothetical protein CP973_20950 [Streptomyces albofaciens JCM 4342]